jgi:hypothetical protein
VALRRGDCSAARALAEGARALFPAERAPAEDSLAAEGAAREVTAAARFALARALRGIGRERRWRARASPPSAPRVATSCPAVTRFLDQRP